MQIVPRSAVVLTSALVNQKSCCPEQVHPSPLNFSCEIPQGGVPPDGTPVQMFREVNQALFICYTILASTGVVFAVFCMLFNIIFRKRK